MDRFFIKIYHTLNRRKLVSLGLLLLMFVGLVFTASKLKFEEDITKLIPNSEKADIANKVLQHVKFADKIIVYLEVKKNGTEDDLTQYASVFVDSLNQYKEEYISSIQGQIASDEIDKTLDFISQNIPLFLEDADYKYIEQRLHKDSIQNITKVNYKTLISPTGIVAKKTILNDPLGITFLGLKKLEQLKIDDNFKIHNGFLITKDNKNLLLFIVPKLAANETDGNTLFVDKLYKTLENLNKDFSDTVSSEYYGSTVIAVTNASQIKHDIQFTISIAMSILLLILIFFYRKLLIPIILFVPTVFGALLAVAILYLLKGQISSISLGIGSVLLGITLDYALHILTHYRNNNDVKQLYKDVTKPILMSSITTAMAYLCLLFLKSEALRDLGVFASISVVGSSIMALLFIPLAYRLKDDGKAQKKTVIDNVASYPFHKSKLLIVALTVVFLVSLFTYKNVIFDQDISKMNFQTEGLKATEKKLDDLMNFASKSIYVTAYSNTIEETLTTNNTIFEELSVLKADDKLLSFSSIGSIVLSKKDQKEKIAKWNNFWQADKKATLQKHLIESGTEFGFKPTTFKGFYKVLDSEFTPVNLIDYQSISSLFLDEFISNQDKFSTAVSLVKVEDKNLEEVSKKLSGLSQTVVIDRKHINETFLGSLKDDFNKLIGYSLLAVALILILFFRSVELALITIIPIILTWMITIGVMGLLGISFNIFNIIISTFVFGLGVDYSIFMTNGLLKKHKYCIHELATYKTSILLSVITTILGVGVLIVAKHPALQSVSIISIIGILSAVLISFTIQPLIFNFFIGWRISKGLAPLQLRTFIHSVILFSIYGVGAVILSILSITIFPLIPISKKKKMKWLHGSISKLVTIVLYGNPFIKKRIINPHQETFEKPAVIIANHSSFIDTLTIGMVTPNVIYLVNDWVYQSPIFGVLARVVGFYPVSSGVDGNLDHLKEKIQQGYCLVVFPEARRSFTNKIGRFHKGAFFLAEQLELDILPLYLHGNAEVIPKKDYVIYDGSLTVKIGERIKFNDTSFGVSARERTKKISSFFKGKFNILRTEIEQAGYFEGVLLSNYKYKGAVLYQAVKSDYNLNKQLYKDVADLLPHKAKIAHVADDYGQLDILLVSQYLDREITTFIDDKEQRSIAENCYTAIHKNIKYVKSVDELSINEVLLVSAENNKILAVVMQLSFQNLKEIILIKNNTLADLFKTKGFVEQEQTNSSIVYLKK